MENSRSLDKFYTKKDVVESFMTNILSIVDVDSFDYVIEPSAGNGSFIEPISMSFPEKQHHFLDIFPEHEKIEKQDFLKYRYRNTKTIIIGNPPFGVNATLAIKFFNHSARLLPEYICFILPKTFMKPRFWSALNDDYSLIFQQELGKNSFTFCGQDQDVPCVKQIWKKQQRIDNLPKKLQLFYHIGVGNVFIRRVGGKAGQIVSDYNESTTYRVSCSDETKQKIYENCDRINTLASKTVGVKSITLFEIEDIIFNRY